MVDMRCERRGTYKSCFSFCMRGAGDDDDDADDVIVVVVVVEAAIFMNEPKRYVLLFRACNLNL